MDKILALLLSVVPTSHAQIVQNDVHSHAMSVAIGQVVNCDKDALQASLEGAGLYTKEKKGHYVLDVIKINDDYIYTLKNNQNGKETKFSIESEINSNVGTSNFFGMQNKLHSIQDKVSFDEATETIKSLN